MKSTPRRPFVRFVNGSRSHFRVSCCLIVCSLLSVLAPFDLYAGGGPENVVVVVNADSASSKMIANYYIQGRNIPSRNVIYLNDIPPEEFAQLNVVRDKILKPILHEIELRKLVGSVDCIVYSSDFPTIVINSTHLEKLKEAVKEQTGSEPSTKLFNPNASLTSATYFVGAVISDDPGYMLLESNSYYRQPAQVLLRRPFVGDAQNEFAGAIGKIDSPTDTELKSAIKTLEGLLKKNPQQLAVCYWLAKFHGKSGDTRNAAAWLGHAVRLGWCFQKQTLADQAFDKVKNDSVFKGIVNRIPDQPFDFVPTRGFKQRYAWGPNGMINQQPGQGNRYFLSTVLAVTRNQGTSERQALHQLRLSMAADESKPEGTFYFTDTSDVRTRTRKPNFEAAIQQLEKMGHKTKIVTAAMPTKARDVIGLTCGTAGFSWTATGSKIIPGAFCDNLTSYGGRLSYAGQTKISEFIANGAAGASGTVVEPFAIQAKFPHPMVHVHYARGCSLAEAFYQSVHGPFQTLIVGDALCQPWATKPVLKVEGVSAGDTIKGKTKWKLDASQSPVPIVGFEFYVDGVLVNRIPIRDDIAFDTTDMADGYHEIRLVSIANTPIETTGHVVLPVEVNNKGESLKLTTEHVDYLDTDKIRFKATTNFGDSIELVQNGRSLAKKIGRDVDFEVAANLLGRGPVSVYAIAISESGGEIASVPLALQVSGRISEMDPRKVLPK